MQTITQQQIMHSHYEQWLSSGLSKSEYARVHELIISNFYYWTRKIELAQSSKGSVGFTQLDISPEVEKDPIVVLHYPNGVKLDIYERIASVALRELIILV